LWLPQWPIQRLVAAAPEYRQRHLVLFRIDARQGKRVAAASPLARRAGVCTDMPLNEASSLIRRAVATTTDQHHRPDARQPRSRSLTSAHPSGTRNRYDGDFFIFQHDPAADDLALQQLSETLEKFSPVIGIEQNHRQIDGRKKTKPNPHFRPSSILLDVTGLSHLFGGYESLAGLISQHCHDRDYYVRIAISNTLGLAWGVSHFSPRCQFDQPQIAPLDETSQADTETMGRLPVAGLRINASTCQTLQRLGIETIGQLLAIDRGDLRTRLGEDLIRRIDQMTGAIEEPVIVCRTAPEFTVNQSLEYATCHRETIEVVISRLIEQLCTELASRQLGSLQWKFRLLATPESRFDSKQETDRETRTFPSSRIHFCVSLFHATATAGHVIPLAAMQLEQSLLQRSGDRLNVHQIIVEVSSCVLLVPQQRHLFDENPRLDRQSLAHLINRLSNRLGNDNVVYPNLRSGAQPERSFQFRPLIDPYRQRRKSKTNQTSHVFGRPLRLLTPPLAISVNRNADDRGEPAFRKPQRIAFDHGANRTAQTITRAWGPERIETGWWRGETVQRDYWRIVTQAGTQFWIFCDLRTKQWFVHGEF
jgi:protein ImuB